MAAERRSGPIGWERLEPLVAVRIPRLRNFLKRHIAPRFHGLEKHHILAVPESRRQGDSTDRPLAEGGRESCSRLGSTG